MCEIFMHRQQFLILLKFNCSNPVMRYRKPFFAELLQSPKFLIAFLRFLIFRMLAMDNELRIYDGLLTKSCSGLSCNPSQPVKPVSFFD